MIQSRYVYFASFKAETMALKAHKTLVTWILLSNSIAYIFLFYEPRPTPSPHLQKKSSLIFLLFASLPIYCSFTFFFNCPYIRRIISGMALLGCDVILTDQLDVLPLLTRNVDRNKSWISQGNSDSGTYHSGGT